MTRYEVVHPYQVHHEGTTYSSGQHVDLPESVGDAWEKNGWVEPLRDAPKPRTRKGVA